MVKKLDNALPPAPKRKRVAAYARVSMDSEQLMHSLSAQVSYYSDLIQKNPAWEYAGVYADEGITGTNTKHRDEFKRLMADCDAGKIDIILVKSISRFARNTVDCLNAVRHLKEIGVEVRFERENISTFSGEGEFMLTILASFAQEESESLSRNQKWAVKKKFERGESNTPLRCFGYDWDSETGTCVVNEDEAGWVRYIFRRYLEGGSLKGIARELTEQGVKTIRGKSFAQNSVRGILQNELYVGDVLLQKYYSPEVKKHMPNRGEMPKYLVSDTHEAIISREDFQKVQERLEERALESSNYGYTPHRFAGLVHCGKCGHSCYYYRTQKEESSTIECGKRKSKECNLLPIRENELAEAWEKATTKRDEPQDAILYDDCIVFQMKSGAAKTMPRNFPSGIYSCFSRKIICSSCGRSFARARSHYCKTIWRTCRKGADPESTCDIRKLDEAELIEAAKQILETEDYEIKFYCEVEKVLVYNDRLDFIFKEGGIKSWKRR